MDRPNYIITYNIRKTTEHLINIDFSNDPELRGLKKQLTYMVTSEHDYHVTFHDELGPRYRCQEYEDKEYMARAIIETIDQLLVKHNE